MEIPRLFNNNGQSFKITVEDENNIKIGCQRFALSDILELSKLLIKNQGVLVPTLKLGVWYRLSSESERMIIKIGNKYNTIDRYGEACLVKSMNSLREISTYYKSLGMK